MSVVRIANGAVAEVLPALPVGLPPALLATYMEVSWSEPKVGWVLAHGMFYAPSVTAPAVTLTSLGFMALFTASEQTAIAAAAIASPALLLWFFQAMGAQSISLSDPRTVAGIAALVGAGLLTAAREAQVLAGAPPPAAAPATTATAAAATPATGG